MFLFLSYIKRIKITNTQHKNIVDQTQFRNSICSGARQRTKIKVQKSVKYRRYRFTRTNGRWMLREHKSLRIQNGATDGGWNRLEFRSVFVRRPVRCYLKTSIDPPIVVRVHRYRSPYSHIIDREIPNRVVAFLFHPPARNYISFITKYFLLPSVPDNWSPQQKKKNSIRGFELSTNYQCISLKVSSASGRNSLKTLPVCQDVRDCRECVEQFGHIFGLKF